MCKYGSGSSSIVVLQPVVVYPINSTIHHSTHTSHSALCTGLLMVHLCHTHILITHSLCTTLSLSLYIYMLADCYHTVNVSVDIRSQLHSQVTSICSVSKTLYAVLAKPYMLC
eukprot:GHVQ01003385.1.p1 GENE.GHVQ01003385.1~~GHVQ01003385.1.p1  ORF type:complete len:113 (+),score=12.98 GHVQ01003385.1:84-422(+)